MSNRALAEEIIFPGSGFTIQRNTQTTGKDNRYYIVKDGQAGDSFKTLAQAKKALEPLLKEIGWEPVVGEPPLKTAEEMIRADINWRVQHESELFDSNSHMYKKRPKGPK